jgi:acyl-CoA thioester hydrolase
VRCAALRSRRVFRKARVAHAQRADRHRPYPRLAKHRYKLSLTKPDTISVGAEIPNMEEDRFIMKYAVVSHKHQKSASKGDGFIVMCSYTEGKKIPIPEEIRMKILA